VALTPRCAVVSYDAFDRPAPNFGEFSARRFRCLTDMAQDQWRERRPPTRLEHLFATMRTMETHEIEILRRSAAMQQPGTKVAVDRSTLVQLLGELIEARQLLGRLGADLKAVEQRALPS
jgi:hypothetical protein